jgi:type IV pilus assembly protein PilA
MTDDTSASFGQQYFNRRKSMNRIIKRHCKGEKGFTLVELLIVFTLLAVLAAIMIPNVSGFVAYGHTQAATAELSVVQTAMDAMMAKENVSSVNVTTATSNMASFPDSSLTPLYPGYLRFTTTKGTYTCSATGLVAQATTGY